MVSKGLRPFGSGGGGAVGGLGGGTKFFGLVRLEPGFVGESKGLKSLGGGGGTAESAFLASDGIGGGLSKGLGLAFPVFMAGGVGSVAFSLKGFSPSFLLLDVSEDGNLGLAACLTGGAGVGAGGMGGGGGGSWSIDGGICTEGIALTSGGCLDAFFLGLAVSGEFVISTSGLSLSVFSAF